MEKKDFLPMAVDVINRIDKNAFTSHDFLDMFRKCCSQDYIEMLTHYNNIGNEENPITTVHKLIGKWLLEGSNNNQLSIQKIGEVESKTILGEKSQVAEWEKIKK